MVKLGWLVPDAPDSLESFRRYGRKLTHVSPTWLRLDADARLHAAVQPEVARLCREYGVALVPLVVNERFKADVAGSILGDPTRRRRAAEALAEFAQAHRVAGINLDFEGPFGRWRHHYSEFVQDLADRLHAMGISSVRVATPRRGRPGASTGRRTGAWRWCTTTTPRACTASSASSTSTGLRAVPSGGSVRKTR